MRRRKTVLILSNEQKIVFCRRSGSGKSCFADYFGRYLYVKALLWYCMKSRRQDGGAHKRHGKNPRRPQRCYRSQLDGKDESILQETRNILNSVYDGFVINTAF